MYLPPHAYVPGRTARHDPGIFASLRGSVRPGMGVDDLAASAAWAAGWRFFEHGYFWEAHEALEPVWMQTQPNSAERHLVQAIIQLANAGLKDRMGRPRAVLRLCDLAESHLYESRAAGGDRLMGVSFVQVAKAIDAFRKNMQ